MPNNRKTYKLSQVTTKIGSGATPRGGKGAYKEFGISLIRSQNVLDFKFSTDGLAFIDEEQASKLNNVNIEENDVLLNITGDSVARVCSFPNEFIPARVNQHVAIVRADNKLLDANYLKYSLLETSNKNLLLTLASAGATRNALTKSMIEDFELNLPRIPDQKAIASILSAIDDKIENNLAINNTLEDMAMALYKHWFVDFGPFQDGEFIDSELGLIPKGWEVKLLGDLVEKLSKGTTPRMKDVGDLDCIIPFLKVRDVNDNGVIDKSGLSYIPEKIHLNQLKRSILMSGDLLFSIAGTIGRVSIVPENLNNSNCNQALAFIRLSDKSKYNSLIYNWLKSEEVQNEIESSIVQGVQANVSLTVLKELQLVIPNNETMVEFSKIINPIHNLILDYQSENQTLTQLRDTLLPKLISGEVRLKGFQEQVIAREGKSELLYREDNVLTMIIPKPVTRDAAIIGTHIVSRLAESNGMGRTKFQKVLHLGEYYCEKGLGGLYKRNAAGPHNDILLKTIEGKFKNYRHVSIASKTLNGRKHIIYKTTPRTVESESIYKSFSEDLKLKLDYLIDVLEPLNLKQTEAISTLYAVWNNRLIRSAEVSSQCLKKDFYNWSDRKRKEFTDKEIAEAIEIMKHQNLIPRGWGDYIN